MRQHDLIQERYLLDKPLGKGGMAEVWCARDQRLERPVAIKFLAPQFHSDPEFLVRFFSEAQSVARISHSSVVSVLDFGEFEEYPYLVMEYVGGGSVADLTGQPLLPERAAEIVSQAGQGAGAAHALGLVHRDIKPGNILLTDEGEAKLADFGIASSVGGERFTGTGQAIGSPHYLSPEQASGTPVTARSDVYSLGVVLYELVTGVRPFEADNVTAIAIAHVDQAPRPPSELVEGLDPSLEHLILRCLAKDPADRFADGSELAAALGDPRVEPAAMTTVVPSGAVETDESPTPWSRFARATAVAALILGLLAAGVWAMVRDPGPERVPSVDQERVERDPGRERRSPSPETSSTVTAPIGVQPAASPSPSEDDAEEDQPSGGGGAGGGGPGGGGGGSDPAPEPEPSDPPPSPEPSAEPTTAPSPGPSDAPAPTP
jgi:eukaryotic-like serine/threonine-protein kinase